MGICNHKQHKQELTYSTKAVLNSNAFSHMNFYFSTESLLRVDADCLVLFTDSKINLKKNPYLEKAGKFETRKIQEFAEAYIIEKMINFGDQQKVIVFPINIASLRFGRVALICLKEWNGHDKLKVNLTQTLDVLFDILNNSRTQTVAFTEFNPCFGIPANVGSRILAKELYGAKQYLKTVTLILIDDNSQNIYMDRINNYKTEQTESKGRTTSVADSNYF